MEESVITKKPKSKLRKYFRTFVLIAAAVIVLLVYWNSFNVNSKGERTGVLIKIQS